VRVRTQTGIIVHNLAHMVDLPGGGRTQAIFARRYAA